MIKPLMDPWIAEAFGQPLALSWQQEADEWFRHLRSAIGPLTSVSNAPDGTLVAFGGQMNAEDPPQNEMWLQCGDS
jgi:hypothetical protein